MKADTKVEIVYFTTKEFDKSLSAAFLGGGQRQKIAIKAPQHEVYVRQNLTEGEAHLMGIERLMENDRYDICGRSCCIAARLSNRCAAPFVVLDKFVDSCMQPIKRKLMTGQYQCVRGESGS